jgi:uncharacterized protein
MSPIDTASATVKLYPSPIEPSWIIDGNPQASSCMLSESADRFAWTVVWECTRGRFNWHYDLDETMLILEGSIILESDTLPPTRYSAGDVILFRRGAHARWYVEDYVKKLAFCRKARPAFVSFVVRLLRTLKPKFLSPAKYRSSGALLPIRQPHTSASD